MTNKTIAAGNVVLKMKGDGIVAEANRIKTEMRQLQTVIRQSTPPAETYASKMRILKDAFSQNAINARQFANAQEFLKQKYLEQTNAAGSLEAAWSKAAISLGKYVAAGYAISQITSLVKSSVQLASELESASIQFEVLSGSAAQSDALVASMRNLADTTPLSFKGVTAAAQTMLAFGVETDKVVPTLRQLGDVTRGDDERLKSLALAFSQASSAGRLMGQDLLQMVNAGFNPLMEISQKTGASMIQLKKQMEDGAISMGLVEMALASATGEGGRFNGMLERQRETAAGKFAELKANIDVLKTQVGSELLPVLSKVTEELVKWTAPTNIGGKGIIGESIDAVSWWQANVKDFFATAILAPDTGQAHTGFLSEFNKQKDIERYKAMEDGKRIAEEQEASKQAQIDAEMKARLEADAAAVKATEEKDKKEKAIAKEALQTKKAFLEMQERELEQAQKRLEVEKYGKAIAEANEATRKGASPEIARQIEQMVMQTEELDKQQKMAEKFKRDTESAKKKAEELARDPFESMVNKIQDLQKLLNVNAIDKSTFDKAAAALGADYQKEIKGDASGMAKTASFGSSEAYKLLVGGKSKQEQQLDRSIAVQQAILEVQRRTEGHLRNQTSLRAYR